MKIEVTPYRPQWPAAFEGEKNAILDAIGDVAVDVHHMEIRPYQDSDETALIQLWADCGLIAPQNNPIRDIQRKLEVNPEWFLVGLKEEKIIASCMVGYEGHRGWINYPAVAPIEQRKGHARQLMEEAECLLGNAGCPKINLQIRSSNSQVIKFYESIGFSDDRVISLGKRLETDAPYEVKQEGTGQAHENHPTPLSW